MKNEKLKTNETDYWIGLLYDTEYINQAMHQDIKKDVKELIKLLVTIVKSSKKC